MEGVAATTCNCRRHTSLKKERPRTDVIPVIIDTGWTASVCARFAVEL